MLQQKHDRTTIAILGGDSMVGQTLELMLEGGGYDARFLNGSFVDRPAELPEEIQVVILMPGLHPRGLEGFLNGMERASTRARIPVLKLVSVSDRTQDSEQGSVLWPCRVKDLKREIEAALIASSSMPI